MNISIAIATYNRAEEVRRTLSGLRAIECPHNVEYEVIVICNNCSDHTTTVVNAMIPLFGGRLRCVYEDKQGLSHARNRAIAEARFEVIAFIDDDVDVDPGWLRAMSEAYDFGDFAVVGGRASLVYTLGRPRWLDTRDEGYLTQVELGPARRPAQPDELFGLNVSIRRDWITRAGLFRTDLGRMGKCLLGGEETDLLERIHRIGGALLYEPAAWVGHRVPMERLRRRWFWSRSYWGQRGEARRLDKDEINAYSVLRSIWWSLSTLRGVIFSSVVNGPASYQCFHNAIRLAARIGFSVGMLRCWIIRIGAAERPSALVQTRGGIS